MNVFSAAIAIDDNAATPEEHAHICREAFEHVCKRALKSHAILHLRQESGRFAHLLRLKDGGEALVFQPDENTLKLGFRAADKNFRTVGKEQYGQTEEDVEWIATENNGVLECKDAVKLLTLKI